MAAVFIPLRAEVSPIVMGFGFLSVDLVRLGPGAETDEVVLTRVNALFGFDGAALFVADVDTPSGLAELVAVGDTDGLEPGRDRYGSSHAPERLPLLVGNHNLGLIVLRGERPPLGPGESRVLRSFCDQLALVLERDRLQQTATDAEVYRRGETMRRALLAAVSHDLRSPLAAIKASVTDLLDPEVERPADDEREVLRTIDRESDRLNALIADLLDMSRIEAGTLRARQEEIDVREVLTRCVDIVAREHPAAAGRISLAPGEPRALGDPTLVERVVVNLLANAVRASDGETSSIEVRASRVAERVVVRVVDHGEGTGPNAREQLFYPFYRLDERNPRLGSGLGLAICKGYVEAMRGEIWVEDTPGGGATFAFALPHAERPA
jgi:two-component system sensor histidine kinase KdpD